MRYLCFAAIALFLISCSDIDKNNEALSGYINPLICTSGDHGQTDPSANVRFERIKVGPYNANILTSSQEKFTSEQVIETNFN